MVHHACSWICCPCVRLVLAEGAALGAGAALHHVCAHGETPAVRAVVTQAVVHTGPRRDLAGARLAVSVGTALRVVRGIACALHKLQ